MVLTCGKGIAKEAGPQTAKLALLLIKIYEIWSRSIFDI